MYLFLTFLTSASETPCDSFKSFKETTEVCAPALIYDA